MPYLIGTDEAGYGPNLGPLTISGTLWKSDVPEQDLYTVLHEVVSKTSSGLKNSNRLQIADSKKVYLSRGSIENLETAVLALVFVTTQKIPANWRELVELICPSDVLDHLINQPWYFGQSYDLPIRTPVAKVLDLAGAFADASERLGVALLEIHCVPVFPPQFNALVERSSNKATVLSNETLKIVRRLKDRTDDDLEIGCDKHGGRSRYGDLIRDVLTDSIVTVGDESRHESDYFFRENNRDVVLRFQANGESFLPTALASMVSKYVREVFMAIWNQYWTSHIPSLKPTKGYPVDAIRFKSDIATTQSELGIPDSKIWRCR